MSAPSTQTTDRPDDAQNKDDQKKSGSQLSVVQLSAGALAAVSSAVVASFFGVAGTLIGAAVASVISTITTTMYKQSLQKTNDRLRKVREQVTRRSSAQEESAAPSTAALPAHLDPRRPAAGSTGIRWPRVAVYAGAVFVLAMGIVTVIELVGQRPVSALVAGTETSQSTTIGTLTEVSSSSPAEDGPARTPTAPPTTPADAPETESPAPPAPETESEDPTSPTGTAAGVPEDTEKTEDAEPTRNPVEEAPESEPKAPVEGSDSAP